MGMRMRRKLMMMGGALPPFLFDLDEATFTASAAIRTDPKGVWAGALLSQTKFDGSNTGDVISLGRGTVISGYWYPTFDPNQGNIPLLWTPEKDRTAAQTNDEYLFYISAAYWLRYEHDQSRFVACVGTQTFNITYTTVAGTSVGLILSYDCNNKANVDGTYYARFAIGDTLTFGITTQPTVSAPDATIYIGSNVGTLNANGVIAGLHISRDPVWYDGTYGVDLDGGRDIVNLIYAAGAYADPAEITKGGWGYTLGLPTNATPGALVSGTGHAWSMNHAGNLLGIKTGFMLDGFGCDQAFAVGYNATTTSAVVADGAAIQDLHDAAFTAECWVRPDGYGESNSGRMIDKSPGGVGGFFIAMNVSTGIYAYVDCATTNAVSTSGKDEFDYDGKWHHVAMYFNDAGDRKIYLWIDGTPVSSYQSQVAGVGAIVTDVGNDLYIGDDLTGATSFDGDIGWIRISDNDRYTAGGAAFTPPRTMPADDANTVLLIPMSEGTGTVLDNAASTGAAYDATLSNGTWTRKFAFEGTPDSVAELSVAERMFGLQGWKVTSSGANIGVYYDMPVTAGQNFAQRALAYSDGTSVPKMVFYDVDNAAEIGSLTSDVANRVQNGDFAAGDSKWAKQTGWTIPGTTEAHCDGSQTGESSVYQIVANQVNGGVIVGRFYKLTYTVKNRTAGSILGSIGYRRGTWRTTDGTYTEYLDAYLTVTVEFIADADFVGEITNISCVPTSNRAHPQGFLFTCQAPAGCSHIRVILTNTDATASDVTYWHQAEVY